MAKLADKETKWSGLVRRFKKQRALEQIMAQPFYRPGEVFYFGPQWSGGLIEAMRAEERFGLIPRIQINQICGVDMAAPGWDQTSVSVWRNQAPDPTAEYAERQGRMDAVSRRMAEMVRNIQVAGEDLSTRAYRA
ncbi:MAG: hypothetical protein WA085_13245, partial [Sphingobium sp.]